MTNQQNTKRVTITTDDDGKNVVIRNSQTGEVIPMVESCNIHIDASTVVPRASLTVWNPSIDITCDAEIHENDIEKQEVIISTGKNIPGIKVYFPGVDITQYYTSYAKVYASGPHGTPAKFSLLVKEYGAVDPNLDEEESIAFEVEKKCISGRLKDALARIADLELQLKQRLHEETQQRKPLSDEDADNAAEQAYWQFDARRSGYAEFRGHPQSERDAFKAEARGLAKRYFPVRVD